MDWVLSYRADPRARVIADRHYNRQSIGAANFMPPGRCMVLLKSTGDAVWGTSWPFAEYVHHAWAGAWINSIFRNESDHLSSDLIRQALACTRWYFGEPPELGMITFVDTGKVRKKRDFGRCYRRAGFQHVGFTQSGLMAFQMKGADMPEPAPPMGAQLVLPESA